ncbi:MAG: AbrB/MazE/SpoVT family DNA-binding domain-containing protein [Candidatus Bathyarchaeota archaeon]|nr:AbrB/MazE/SpoVT family DNA-binding domain-containing protein [Candidatus Bathyarchaeota archaeon]
MASEVRLSSKYRVVIPQAVREKLGLCKGDTLIVDVDGDTIRLRKRPESFTDYGRGLHRDVWDGVDSKRYLSELRTEWELL